MPFSEIIVFISGTFNSSSEIKTLRTSGLNGI